MHLVLPIILAWLSGVLVVIAFFIGASDDEWKDDEGDK